MAMHTNINRLKLDDEVQLLKKAGKKIIAIVPEVIEIHLGYGVVDTYIIIFEDKK